MPCVLLPSVVAHRVARFILRPTPVPRRIHCAELSEVMPVVGVRAAIFSNALLVWIVRRSVMPRRGCSTLPRACHVEVLSSFCHRSDRQHQGISSNSSRALRKPRLDSFSSPLMPRHSRRLKAAASSASGRLKLNCFVVSAQVRAYRRLAQRSWQHRLVRVRSGCVS